MFRPVMRFTKLEIAVKKYRKATDVAIEQVMKESMKEALETVILHVPTYTGMARGSLRPIGRVVEANIMNITPAPGAVDHPEKTIAKGEAAGSDFVFYHKDGRHFISFKNAVEHYETNEHEQNISLPLIHPTPWESWQAGREVYKAYLRDQLTSRVPNVKKFVTKTEVIRA